MILKLYHLFTPDYNGNDFINLLFNLFHKYISREMYICGYYNINLLNNTVLSNSFKNILIQLGISNIIDMPTRITQNSISSLDNIFTNCSDAIQGVIHTDISDHSLIFCIFNYNLFINLFIYLLKERINIHIHEILMN